MALAIPASTAPPKVQNFVPAVPGLEAYLILFEISKSETATAPAMITSPPSSVITHCNLVLRLQQLSQYRIHTNAP
eukprot:467308-Rhodomonas_salina.1